MNPKKGQFRSRQIADSQAESDYIRHASKKGEIGAGYVKGSPSKYTSEEGFQEATPKIKGDSPKRIKQAFGRE